MSRRLQILAAACFFTAAFSLPQGSFAQSKKGSEEGNLRIVQGTVTNAQDVPVQGAVVQLKNTKTLQIRSFITKEQGAYVFHGLSTDVIMN